MMFIGFSFNYNAFEPSSLKSSNETPSFIKRLQSVASFVDFIINRPVRALYLTLFSSLIFYLQDGEEANKRIVTVKKIDQTGRSIYFLNPKDDKIK